MNTADIIGQAITLNRNGDRQQALEMLVELAQQEPGNEQVWLCVAEISDNLDDCIMALQKALAINPDNPLARARLKRHVQQKKQHQAEQLLQAEGWSQKAQQAAKAHEKEAAIELLIKALRVNPQHLQSWLLLSNLSVRINEKIEALEQAHTIHPANPIIGNRLNHLKRVEKNPLALGDFYEQEGYPALAFECYQRAVQVATSPARRLEAERRLENVEIHRMVKSFRSVNPWVTLTRLAMGPVVFYLLLVLIQSGLNPTLIHPLFLAGGLFVLLGSFLLVITRTAPTRGLWLMLYGAEGRREALARASASALGLLVMLAPFGLLLIDSLQRIGLLWLIMGP